MRNGWAIGHTQADGVGTHLLESWAACDTPIDRPRAPAAAPKACTEGSRLQQAQASSRFCGRRHDRPIMREAAIGEDTESERDPTELPPKLGEVSCELLRVGWSDSWACDVFIAKALVDRVSNVIMCSRAYR